MAYEAALIILYDSKKRFLLQHRSKEAKLLPNYWAFFGGGISKGEAPEEAVRREAYEELGYKIKSPRLLLKRNFKEGNIKGCLHIYIENFDGHKRMLRLREGRGWGWFSKIETKKLRMIPRDREVIRYLTEFLNKSIDFKIA